jgi:hypothetical protein
MRTPAPRPARDAESSGVPLCDIVLYDAEGTVVRLWCRVEQVAVDKAGGAEPDRLNQQGEVIGHSAHLVWVKFDHGSQSPVPLRPHLLRMLEMPKGF